jgi:hypothetical protein
MSRAFMIKQAPFKPTDIAGCQLWLDGADRTTITGTSAVTQWNDKSGNGYNGTVVNAAVGSPVAPSYLTNSINGLPAITMSGTSYFTGSTNVNSTTLTCFFLGNCVFGTGGSSQQRILGLSIPGSDDFSSTLRPIPLSVISGGTQLLAYRNANMASATVVSGTNFIGCCIFDGTSNYMYKDGTLGTQVSSSGTFTTSIYGVGSDAGTQFMGGTSSLGTNCLVGKIGEMILFNTALTTPQRQQIESYLAQKWGLRQQLPQGHPGTRGIVYPSQAIPTAIYWRYPTPFVPTSIGGCQLWLDGVDPAGTGTSPSNGATVSTWVDKATAKNATATGTSTYLTGGGINFTGSSYFLNQTFSQNLSQRSIFIVFQETTNSQYAGVFPIIPNPNSGNDQTTTNGLSSEITNNTLLFVGNGTGYQSSVGSGNPLPKAIYYDSMNGTTGSGYFNGTNAANVTAGYTAGTCSGYGLGGRWQAGSMSGSYRLNGVIYEILFFNTSLNTLNRQTIEGYLAWKWGLQANLPANHPYKNVSPNITNPGGVSRPANVLPIPPITCTPVSKIRTLITQVFTYTGSIQTYTVPAGVTSVVLYMWGAGGGTSQPVGGFVNYSGGAGAMVQGVYPVTPASTLYVVVGKGGVTNQSIQSDAQGGGGAANSAGGGGGRSAIQLTSGGADVVVAGGGGGAGLLYANNNGTGGPAYFSGSSPNTLAAVVGYGGTQTAGGAGGGNGGGAGSLKFGGAGTGPGAGGGGGYYGGGGMGNGDQGWGPGGGGSSLIDNLSLIPGESVLGFNSTNLSGAPNTTSPYYVSNVAAGGIGANATGGNGRVVVGYYL